MLQIIVCHFEFPLLLFCDTCAMLRIERRIIFKRKGDDCMLEWIKSVMKNGYVDEHGHELYGAAAIAHFMNRPVNSISQHEIEAGKKFVQKYISK